MIDQQRVVRGTKIDDGRTTRFREQRAEVEHARPISWTRSIVTLRVPADSLFEGCGGWSGAARLGILTMSEVTHSADFGQRQERKGESDRTVQHLGGRCLQSSIASSSAL